MNSPTLASSAPASRYSRAGSPRPVERGHVREGDQTVEQLEGQAGDVGGVLGFLVAQLRPGAATLRRDTSRRWWSEPPRVRWMVSSSTPSRRA